VHGDDISVDRRSGWRYQLFRSCSLRDAISMHLIYLIGVPSMIVLPVRLEAGIMNSYATTKLSSKGQVVIPEEVRNDLGLNEGDQFVVIGQGYAA
jgi:AbrB family looped-hinge helix DNA binding protein